MTIRTDKEAPDFVPVHKLPCWLSSEDVLLTIRWAADQGVDKAACWDFTQAIYRLIERTQSSTLEQGGGE